MVTGAGEWFVTHVLTVDSEPDLVIVQLVERGQYVGNGMSYINIMKSMEDDNAVLSFRKSSTRA